MKKILAVLFCIFATTGCQQQTEINCTSPLVTCSLISAGTISEEVSYAIDPVATANVPWKMNEVVYVYTAYQEHQPLKIERRFLGVTSNGNYAVQEFYAQENLKYTSIFLMASEASMFDDIRHVCLFEQRMILGAYIGWYRNGNKMCECFYENGQLQGKLTYWYENGQKTLEGFSQRLESDGDMLDRSRQVGVWFWWDKEGNLIEENDYGSGE